MEALKMCNSLWMILAPVHAELWDRLAVPLASHPVDLHALEATVALLLFVGLFSLIGALYSLWRVGRHEKQLKKLQKRHSWGVDQTLDAMDQASKSYLSQFLDRK